MTIDRNRPDWEPRAPAVLNDQRAAYDKMRVTCPVAYSDFLGWSLFRHDDIAEVLADPTALSSASPHRAIPNGMDPPEHTRYRTVLESYFDAASMAAFEPLCRAVASELTESLTTSDEIDLISEFAEPFALRSACAFLGWPQHLWTELQGWTHGNQEAALSRDRTVGARLAAELAQHVDVAIQVRKESPDHTRGDLTSLLMATQVDGHPLSDDDIVSILRNWIAGHGTVAAALGILVYSLGQEQEIQQRLRDEPTLIAAAVDEILRVDGPLVANRRTSAHSIDIGGRTIEAGAKLTLMWISANRDERVFQDPDEIDLSRNQQENLLFGAGIHDCLGAPLTRLELRVALEALLAHTSLIELSISPDPIRGVYPSNGFATLPGRLIFA